MQYIFGLIISIIFLFACRAIAASKGRSTTLWAILGFFFTLIALIIILVLPKKTS